MLKPVLFLVTAVALLGADDPWKKVEDLKSHSELRIYKKGAAEPITATFDEANAERMIVVTKNAQIAIAKDDIERIDARPAAAGGRKMTTTSTAKVTEPDYTPHPNPSGINVPGTEYGSGVSFGGSKPNFETVYVRPHPTK